MNLRIYLHIILSVLWLGLTAYSCEDKKDITPDPTRTYQTPEPITLHQEKTKEIQSSKGSYTILDSLPHSTDAFTQGLTYHEEKLIETTGLIGQSKINIINPTDGKVLDYVNLPLSAFGEGNIILDDTLYVITYKNQVLYKYTYPDLKKVSEVGYYGEGWGLTKYDGQILMSNGTNMLTFRNPNTFTIIRSLPVIRNGRSIYYINELETVGKYLYANIWGEDHIIQIDIKTGMVKREWDMRELRYGQMDNHAAEVLNGIAYNPTDSTFFVTGKNWDQIYLLELR